MTPSTVSRLLQGLLIYTSGYDIQALGSLAAPKTSLAHDHAGYLLMLVGLEIHLDICAFGKVSIRGLFAVSADLQPRGYSSWAYLHDSLTPGLGTLEQIPGTRQELHRPLKISNSIRGWSLVNFTSSLQGYHYWLDEVWVLNIYLFAHLTS